jgi:hypothetical protein
VQARFERMILEIIVASRVLPSANGRSKSRSTSN